MGYYFIMLVVISGICFIGQSETFTFGSLRILWIMWWFYCVVIYATYSGNLVAFLAVVRPFVPFTRFQQFIQQSQYKFTIQAETSSTEYFKVGLLVVFNY